MAERRRRQRATKYLLLFWVICILPGYALPWSPLWDATFSLWDRAVLGVISTLVLPVAVLAGRRLTSRLGSDNMGLAYSLGAWHMLLGVCVAGAWLLGRISYMTGPLMSAVIGYIAGMGLATGRERAN
jgi:hypothetical protein